MRKDKEILIHWKPFEKKKKEFNLASDYIEDGTFGDIDLEAIVLNAAQHFINSAISSKDESLQNAEKW